MPTTTSLDATKAAIIAAYRGMWTDIATVEGHYPVNSSDPILTRYATGNERSNLITAATGLQLDGEFLAGPAVDTSRAIVKQLVGAVAVVADCAYDGSILMNGRTNQVLHAAGTLRELVDAEVQYVDGVWQVSVFSEVSPGCTVAS